MTHYAIAFDLDGVILDAKDLHKKLFIEAALKNDCLIDDIYHESHLEALSTKQKISHLIQTGKLEGSKASQVRDLKQKMTMERINEAPLTVPWIPELLEFIRSKGLKIALCSNSVKQTCIVALLERGIIQYFDLIVSNEDVSSQKPAPEVYVVASGRLGTVPGKLIVFEDSFVGIKAAIAAGCIVVPVFDPSKDLDIERVKRWIDYVTG